MFGAEETEESRAEIESENKEETEVPIESGKTHRPEKNFKCPHCIFGCNRKREYELHLWLHDKSDCHVCTVCFYRCKEKSAMNAHKKIHTSRDRSRRGEEAEAKVTFSCEVCKKTFNNKYYLADHVKMHTGDLLKCEHCPYVTPHKSTLATQKTHARYDERPYRCAECDSTYKYKWNLKAHQKKLAHSCHLCSFKACAIRVLAKHIKESHVDQD